MPQLAAVQELVGQHEATLPSYNTFLGGAAHRRSRVRQQLVLGGFAAMTMCALVWAHGFSAVRETELYADQDSGRQYEADRRIVRRAELDSLDPLADESMQSRWSGRERRLSPVRDDSVHTRGRERLSARSPLSQLAQRSARPAESESAPRYTALRLQSIIGRVGPVLLLSRFF